MNDELITLSELAAGGVSALNRLRLLIDRTQRAAIPMNDAWVSLTAEIERALVDQSRGQDTLMRDVQTALSLLAKRTEECEALRARLAAADARCTRLRDDVHTAWSAEREVRERLEAIESFVRRIAEYPMKRSDELGVVSIRAEAKEVLANMEDATQ